MMLKSFYHRTIIIIVIAKLPYNSRSKQDKLHKGKKYDIFRLLTTKNLNETKLLNYYANNKNNFLMIFS